MLLLLLRQHEGCLHWLWLLLRHPLLLPEQHVLLLLLVLLQMLLLQVVLVELLCLLLLHLLLKWLMLHVLLLLLLEQLLLLLLLLPLHPASIRHRWLLWMRRRRREVDRLMLHAYSLARLTSTSPPVEPLPSVSLPLSLQLFQSMLVVALTAFVALALGSTLGVGHMQ